MKPKSLIYDWHRRAVLNPVPRSMRLKKSLLGVFIIAAMIISSLANAQDTQQLKARIDSIADSFLQNMGQIQPPAGVTSLNIQEGIVHFLSNDDMLQVIQQNQPGHANNPLTAYGLFLFAPQSVLNEVDVNDINAGFPSRFDQIANFSLEDNGVLRNATWQMTANEVIVFIGLTPPLQTTGAMQPQYYGFTGYMASRYGTKESETRNWPLSGSLGNTLNHHKTVTENQSTTGGYLDLTAVIFTANRLFKQIVEEQLVQSGFPPNGINVVPIPYIDSSQPFPASCTSDTTGGGSSVIYSKMGYGNERDFYRFLVRATFLTKPEAGGIEKEYLSNGAYARLIRIVPMPVAENIVNFQEDSFSLSGLFAEPEPGHDETIYEGLLNELVNSVVTDINAQPNVQSVSVYPFGPPESKDSLRTISRCEKLAGDNRDDLLIPSARNESYLEYYHNREYYIIGIDHTAVENAEYSSITVNNTDLALGLAAVSNIDYAGSAGNYFDVLGAESNKFYIVKFVPNPDNLQLPTDPDPVTGGVVLGIPERTDTILGINEGEHLFFNSRAYVNPYDIDDYVAVLAESALSERLIVVEKDPVGDVNRPPVLDPIGAQTVQEGVLLEFTVTATDPDGDNVTLSTGVLPPGASFDPVSGVFSWSPDYGQANNYTVLFTVTDDGSPAESDSEQITITVGDVNRPPVLDPIGAQTVQEGALLEFTVTASDPDGDNVTLSTGVLPPGASFDPASGIFSWTPDYGQTNNYTVLFTVTDDGSPAESDSEQITITVGDVNRPPVLDPIGAQTVQEGVLLEFTVTASDPDGDNVTLSTGVLPPGASFDPASGIFSWTPDYGQTNNYTVLFTVTDDGSPAESDSEQITITVGDVNRPPVLDPIGDRLVAEGEELIFTVTANDPDEGDVLSYTAEDLPAGADFNPATRMFSWTPDIGDAGNYAVSFTVTDDGTPPLSDSEVITITVNPAPTTTLELKGESDTEDNAIGDRIRTLLNYGGSPVNFAIGVYGIKIRSLIKWDVSLIPAGSTIVSAQMSLYSYQNYYGGSITIDAHRVLQPWIEGTLDHQDRLLDNPDSSCWDEYGNGQPWEQPGADGPNDRSATVLSSETNDGIGWYSWDLKEAVQKWVDGEWANNGIMLKSANENSNNLKLFAPSEYQDENFRPKLVIEYIQP